METVDLNDLFFFNLPNEWKKSEEFNKVPKLPTKYESYKIINKEIGGAEELDAVDEELLTLISFFEIYDNLDKGLGDFLLENPILTLSKMFVFVECPITKEIFKNDDKAVLLRYIEDNTCYYYLVKKEGLEEYIKKNYTEGNVETKLTEEQLKLEFVINSRWAKEILKFREEKDKFKEEIEGSIKYFYEILKNYNDSLLEEIKL